MRSLRVGGGGSGMDADADLAAGRPPQAFPGIARRACGRLTMSASTSRSTPRGAFDEHVTDPAVVIYLVLWVLMPKRACTERSREPRPQPAVPAGDTVPGGCRQLQHLDARIRPAGSLQEPFDIEIDVWQQIDLVEQ